MRSCSFSNAEGGSRSSFYLSTQDPFYSVCSLDPSSPVLSSFVLSCLASVEPGTTHDVTHSPATVVEIPAGLSIVTLNRFNHLPPNLTLYLYSKTAIFLSFSSLLKTVILVTSCVTFIQFLKLQEETVTYSSSSYFTATAATRSSPLTSSSHQLPSCLGNSDR